MVTVMLMSVVLIAGLCVLAYTLAVYALPFMLLCGRPHKSIYVASRDMWRTGELMLFTSHGLREVRHILTGL